MPNGYGVYNHGPAPRGRPRGRRGAPGARHGRRDALIASAGGAVTEARGARGIDLSSDVRSERLVEERPDRDRGGRGRPRRVDRRGRAPSAQESGEGMKSRLPPRRACRAAPAAAERGTPAAGVPRGRSRRRAARPELHPPRPVRASGRPRRRARPLLVVTFLYTHCPDVCPLIAGNAEPGARDGTRAASRPAGARRQRRPEARHAGRRARSSPGSTSSCRRSATSPGRVRSSQRVWKRFQVAAMAGPARHGRRTRRSRSWSTRKGKERLIYDSTATRRAVVQTSTHCRSVGRNVAEGPTPAGRTPPPPDPGRPRSRGAEARS